MSQNIDEHDFQVKVNSARKFIEEGNRVKATLMMKGRQITKPEMAEEVLTRIAAELSDIAKTEGSPRMEGHNNMSVVLVKKK